MAYRTIGNTIAEWEENEPLRFTMREEVGPRDAREIKTITIDLTGMRLGYTEDFLTHLKEHLLARRHQVAGLY